MVRGQPKASLRSDNRQIPVFVLGWGQDLQVDQRGAFETEVNRRSNKETGALLGLKRSGKIKPFLKSSFSSEMTGRAG